MISLPILRAPTPDSLFQLESDTSPEGVRGTLFRKQGDEWVVIGYHSKRLPASAKNLELLNKNLQDYYVITDNFHHLLMKFHIYIQTHFYTPNDKN